MGFIATERRCAPHKRLITVLHPLPKHATNDSHGGQRRDRLNSLTIGASYTSNSSGLARPIFDAHDDTTPPASAASLRTPTKSQTMRSALLAVAAMGALVFFTGVVLLRPPNGHRAQQQQPGASVLLTHGAAAAVGEEEKHGEAVQACPDRPTWQRFASWDEWTGPNCSLIIPYVPDPNRNAAGTHPLLLIIGEQKGGTTFLRSLLDQHPLRAGKGLFGAEGGEVHFWDQGIRVRHLPTDPKSLARAYADYFTMPLQGGKGSNASVDPEMPFGFDTTPSLLAWRGPAAWRLSLVRPRTKLLLLVRDPVARYESARRMYLCFAPGAQERGEDFHEEGKMDEYLQAAAEAEDGGKEGRKDVGPLRHFWRALPLRRGMYMENLKSFLLHFPDPRDLRIVDSQRLFADPAAVAKAITTGFLRLPGPYAPDVAAAEARGRNAVDDKCSSVLMGGRAAGEYRLREDDREALARFYHPHNQALEAFLGRQFPSWTRPSETK